MSGGSSEEKSLPASSKKLQDERRKGKIAKAPDLLTAITTGALIAYLLAAGGTIADRLREAILVSGDAVGMGFEVGIRAVLAEARSVLLFAGLVPLMVAVAAAVGGSLVINKGFVFSMEPLMPKPEKLNPVTGLMGLYKLDKWVELAKSVVKALLFGGALLLVARASLGPLIEVPVCSPGCVPLVLRSMLVPLLGLGCMFYLAAGAIDLLVQRWLFMRDMRMTKTEAKNERKDTDGNPQVKQQRNRLRREGDKAGRLGAARATLLVCSADNVIGLRYIRGETPLPLVVCRLSGEKARVAVVEARQRGQSLFWDRGLSADLDRAVKLGRPVTAQFFPRVARAIQMSAAR
ncbi:MAG: EscU/YscU/HrcU family type III secretion system export apparatus switch protein [Janthinobacterium lividum]